MHVDVWRQQGIYVLLSNFRPVYVGKAADRNLGSRLRDHLSDRHAGRWDMFSWYGVLDFGKRGVHGREPSVFSRRGLSKNALIDSLEALGIAITDPPLNRKRESIPDAVFVEPDEVEAGLTIEGQLRKIYDFVKEQRAEEARSVVRAKTRRRSRRRRRHG